jgi:FKBP-type peptidyl-prolyl cis-trans isomerase FklB
MKSVGLLPLVLTLALPALFHATAAEAEFSLKDDKDKASYSIGLDIGRTFRERSLELNPEALVRGLRDALGGGKTLLTEEQAQEALETFTRAVAAKEMSARSALAPKNKEAGEKFLAENKTKDGVKATASGLQYKVLKAGTGKVPQATDVVRTHYRGTLIDGTEFDSSYRRNEPATFPVNGVIPGWTEALQLMPVGSKWQLFVPSKLAYGEQGAGQLIGPNATLLFEVELLGIEPGAAPASAKP